MPLQGIGMHYIMCASGPTDYYLPERLSGVLLPNSGDRTHPVRFAI
jgi:hypothetical protein